VPTGTVPARGPIHVYLGPAPGVGKTHAMLTEGGRLALAGRDVVVGWIENHDRQDIATLVAPFERVAPLRLVHRGAEFSEMDLDAVLARHPEVALVDELAHTNVPGTRHKKRWQDVDELLDAGIRVIATVNIQHLESLKEAAARFTGSVARETVPDSIVASAERVDVVDVRPDVLRRRVEQGAVFSPGSAQLALGGVFTDANLAGLRDLTTWWAGIRTVKPAPGHHPAAPETSSSPQWEDDPQ
jgi:two-component system, OmpR family, sensor histidine kinase KdpD